MKFVNDHPHNQIAAANIVNYTTPLLETDPPLLHRIYQGPYFKMLTYAIACLTTSCVYFGWQPYSEMLFRQGAYSWLCGEKEVAICSAQDAAVTRLYSFAQGSEFAFAFVAGLFLDHLGPRKTAIAGQALFALSIILLCFSSQSFQAYIPALFIAGGCVNLVAFPSLVVLEEWPSRQALAVSVIVGAQSGASVIAPILQIIWEKHPQISYFRLWGLYLAIIWLPVASLYIFMLPSHRNYSKLISQPDENVLLTDLEDNFKMTANQLSAFSTASLALSDETPPVGKAKWKAFLRDVKTPELVGCAIFMFLLMLQFAYYPSVVRIAISQYMSDFVGWMTPLQAPFSVVIGFAMDYTGTCLVMYFMCAALVFVSASAAISPNRMPLQRAVAIIFVFSQSATYNIKYTFVNETFDPYNFGKLVGFLGILGGVGVYVNAPIVSAGNHRIVFLVYMGVAMFMSLITSFLYLRKRRGKTQKTTRPPTPIPTVRSNITPI